MSSGPVFNKSLSLSYLGLPETYQPSPQTEPIPFLIQHLTHLPPHLSLHFSYITSPAGRAAVHTIRNRRLKYAHSKPSELSFISARNQWPNLWQGRERRGVEEGAEEQAWANEDFLQGSTKHVGQLGRLLGGYEEEREAQRVRTLRREQADTEDFIPEEDSSDDDEVATPAVEETIEESKASFERLILERFIYGSLEPFDYDKIDWDDALDGDDDREAEERWFDSE